MSKLVECSYLSGCAGARKEGRRIGHSLSSIYGNAHTFFPSFHKTEPSLFPAFLCSPQVIPSKCPPQSHCSYIYIYICGSDFSLKLFPGWVRHLRERIGPKDVQNVQNMVVKEKLFMLQRTKPTMKIARKTI